MLKVPLSSLPFLLFAASNEKEIFFLLIPLSEAKVSLKM